MSHTASAQEKAFEAVYRAHYTSLFYKALDWTLDDDTAKDLVEDVFADLWTRFDNIRMEEVGGLLHMALRNRAINRLRHESVKRRYEDAYISTVAEIMDEPDEVHEQQLQLMRRVIDAQPPRRRHIFTQCCLEDKTYKEVAESIGVEASTVHKHISRVYKELRATFGKK